MTTFEIRTDSWHFPIAARGSCRYNFDKNLCTYFRELLDGFGLILVNSVMISLLISIAMFYFWTLQSSYFWIVQGLTYSWIHLPKEVEFGIVITGGILMFIVSFLVINVNSSRFCAKSIPIPGFLKTVYTNWREKYCISIVIIDAKTGKPIWDDWNF